MLCTATAHADGVRSLLFQSRQLISDLSEFITLLQSQELVLTEMHPLDDIPAVVEDAAYVLSVHGTGEMRVAVMAAISAGCANPLRGRHWKAVHYFQN